jgi:putative intracellular protease/amidase
MGKRAQARAVFKEALAEDSGLSVNSTSSKPEMVRLFNEVQSVFWAFGLRLQQPCVCFSLQRLLTPMKQILMPLPDVDFDVTEVSVPWRMITDAGHQVVFTTKTGSNRPAADPLLLRGVVFGKLGAAAEAKAFYAQLMEAPAFQHPIAYDTITPGSFDGLVLPGGHAPGMRQYLGSQLLQQRVAEFWALKRPVGAICHGVLLLARATDPQTGQSVLRQARTTCLPGYMERLAYYLHLLEAWSLLSYVSEVRAGRGRGGAGGAL